MGKKPLWLVSKSITDMVRQDHRERPQTGGSHDFLHTLMVAQYGEIIAEDERTGELGWVAGICHNTDHLFPDGEIEERVVCYLNQGIGLSQKEKRLILEAVMNHSKLNDSNDNPVTVVLKDADRLANIGPNGHIRAPYPFLDAPPYDPRYVCEPDPLATHKNPRTPFNAIKYSLEWEQMIRLPKAKKIAEPWFEQLRIFIEGFSEQLRETNLLPYPFGEDFARLDK